MYHGKLIRTYRHPEGIIKHAAVLPVMEILWPSVKLLALQEFDPTTFAHFAIFAIPILTA